MLIWNTLSTKENLCQRMLIQDSCCALCKHEIESPIHLFIECPIAKALWHPCCWGLKPKEHSIQSTKFLIKLILDPPNAPCPNEDQWLIPLNMASILDEIWFLETNLFTRDPRLISKLQSPTSMESLLNSQPCFQQRNHLYLIQHKQRLSCPRLLLLLPLRNGLKSINILQSQTKPLLQQSSPATIKVKFLKSRPRSFLPAFHFQQKQPPSTILWAMHLALSKTWNQVIFEGDAEVCFVSLPPHTSTPNWSISNTITNILCLSKSFSSFSFAWVKRKCNRAAHKATRLSLTSLECLCFNNHSQLAV